MYLFDEKTGFTLVNCKKMRHTHLVLYLGPDFMKTMSIPKTVTHLCFGTNRNPLTNGIHPVANDESCFAFGEIYDVLQDYLPLLPDEIPDYVTHVVFANNFNRPLNQNIPNSVTHVRFGKEFNLQLRSGDLPPCLTHLTFGEKFNMKIGKGIIPKSVKSLRFGDLFQQDLYPTIPNSVTFLQLSYFYHKTIWDGDIPNSVTRLHFGVPDDRVNKKKIKFWWKAFDYYSEIDIPDYSIVIPDSVTSLTLGYFFNAKLNKENISSSLKELEFGERFNRKIYNHDLPSSLIDLTFGKAFNQKINPGGIPNSVKSLEYGEDFAQPINKSIPDSVTHIKFGRSFNVAIEKDDIPDSVTHLQLGVEFNKHKKKQQSMKAQSLATRKSREKQIIKKKKLS